MIKSLFSKVLKKARLASTLQSSVHRTSKVEAGSSLFASVMDRYSFCGYDCDFYHANIGSFTSIASRVIIGGARHPMEWVGMSPVFYRGRDSIAKKFSAFDLDCPVATTIGNDVWIGDSAIILSGVTVGNGAVIGAGSIVTHNVPAYCIVAGNPAKPIRYRFDANTIADLEKISWWNLEDNLLEQLAAHIKSPRVFIEEYIRLSNRPPRIE